MSILNLTQHKPTPQQLADGVVDPDEEDTELVHNLLTFVDLPTRHEMRIRAERLADMVQEYGYYAAMIGGAPFFMHELHTALEDRRIVPMYAFSKRISVEQTIDGKTVKRSIFKYEGMIE